MNVGFSDGFFDSLKKINKYETWWYKTYDAIRYDIPRFFKNVWRFRKEMREFQAWDYNYNLSVFRRSLELTGDYLETKGIEIESSRDKKIAKIREVTELIKRVGNDSYIETAEKELGELILRDWEFEESSDHPGSMVLKDSETEEEKAHNSKVFARSNEIAEQEWKLIWEIIKGQDHQTYINKYQKIKESTPEDEMHEYDDWFDGSGIRGWWD
jgi:hypothetical protein